MRMAESEPVVVVEQPVSALREGRLPALGARVEAIEGRTGSCTYRPLHLPQEIPGMRSLMARVNRGRMLRELAGLLPSTRPLVVCYDSPHQYPLVRGLGEDIAVYLAIDDRTLTVRGEPIAGEVEAERRLLERVDVVICVSEPLAAALKSRMRPERNVPVHVLTNGYDERIFDPQQQREEPAILGGVARPRVLVTGHISERIDWEGIAGALSERPEWSWVLVGPADEGMKERVAGLAGRITWFPPVATEQVPALIQHCDACAVPYRLNSFTLASSPLKAVEYLAMGAGVLSTRIPSLEAYGDGIEWVEPGDGKSYAAALDAIRSEGCRSGPARVRRAAAGSQSLGAKTGAFTTLVAAGAAVYE
jgi:glycosyltransferase involved in cell wall biosynthesis